MGIQCRGTKDSHRAAAEVRSEAKANAGRQKFILAAPQALTRRGVVTPDYAGTEKPKCREECPRVQGTPAAALAARCVLSYSTSWQGGRYAPPLHPPAVPQPAFWPAMSRTVRPVHHRRGSTQLHGPQMMHDFPLNQAGKLRSPSTGAENASLPARHAQNAKLTMSSTRMVCPSGPTEMASRLIGCGASTTTRPRTTGMTGRFNRFWSASLRSRT